MDFNQSISVDMGGQNSKRNRQKGKKKKLTKHEYHSFLFIRIK